MSGEIIVRKCESLEDFHRCVELQREIWGEADLEVEPATMFVVAAHTGGEVLGAFDGDRLVGYTLALVGLRDRTTYLHSHMAGVKPQYRDRGVGRMTQRSSGPRNPADSMDVRSAGSAQRALQFEPAWRYLPHVSAEFVRRYNQPAAPRIGDRSIVGRMASGFGARRGRNRKSRQRSHRGASQHRITSGTGTLAARRFGGSRRRAGSRAGRVYEVVCQRLCSGRLTHGAGKPRVPSHALERLLNKTR